MTDVLEQDRDDEQPDRIRNREHDVAEQGRPNPRGDFDLPKDDHQPTPHADHSER